ncbi:46 kDa FK506-binding nuclear protein [Ooceraea biroi]|uniref:46 kDa FK506-binding nuclear protein n=1 Tax=Ooceraea biroi TaxID=2015173 RepID=UPI000F0738E3|nr:46 kDa FK506-binding nuclear protein [Ooceraea biroi]
MFWALILEPHKRYSQCVKNAFHVSMASLDLAMSGDSPVQVMVNYNNKNFLLCTLNKSSTWQVPLDLNFEKETSVTFLCNGRGHVHLTGYMLPHDDWTDSEASEVEEEQDIDTNVEKHSKRKAEELKETKNTKKAKQTEKMFNNKSNNQDMDDSMDEDDTLEDSQDENLYHYFKESLNSDEDEDESKDDEDDDDENEDEDESEDEEEDDEDEDESEDEDEDTDEDVQQGQKQKHKQKIVQKSVKNHLEATKSQQSATNQKKNQQQNQKQNQQQNQKKNQQPNQKQNQQQNQQKKQDKQKLVNGKDEVAKQEQSKKQKKAQNEVKKRTIEGGVQVEDVKLGSGIPARHGKMVSVYYVGRCKIGKDDKKIDACMQGSGFKFRLGKGDVIKGWDIGIVGMKVGGKRRLVIPPNMAYGAKGSPPTIPSNSTLTFDIELKNVD